MIKWGAETPAHLLLTGLGWLITPLNSSDFSRSLNDSHQDLGCWSTWEWKVQKMFVWFYVSLVLFTAHSNSNCQQQGKLSDWVLNNYLIFPWQKRGIFRSISIGLYWTKLCLYTHSTQNMLLWINLLMWMLEKNVLACSPYLSLSLLTCFCISFLIHDWFDLVEVTD